MNKGVERERERRVGEKIVEARVDSELSVHYICPKDIGNRFKGSS